MLATAWNTMQRNLKMAALDKSPFIYRFVFVVIVSAINKQYLLRNEVNLLQHVIVQAI